MKRTTLAVLLLLLGAASTSALAHGGRARVTLGFHFGIPLYHSWHYWGPPPVYYYPAPVYYAPPLVVQSPPVYQQRSDTVPESPGTWFYCPESKAYYPYVRDCPGGWQRVPAQPQ